MIKPLIIANWKMNPQTLREAKKLLEVTKKVASKIRNISVVVAPPAVYLFPLAKDVRGNRIAFAAQDVYFETEGAHTGEISMRQVKDAGANHVLIGHSEVRARGETNDDTRKKMITALSAKLIPVLCVGEITRTNTGEYFNFVSEQLTTGFAGVSQTALTHVIVAYEPVWAIGGEETMSPREMHEMTIFIRKVIVGLYGAPGHKVKILYGGSANEENAAPMLRDGNVDGLLVGHVSVDTQRFSALLESLK